MTRHTSILLIVVGSLMSIVWPVATSASYYNFLYRGYFTMPLAASDTTGVNSWFDHTSPEGKNDASSTMTRYDGVQFFSPDADFANCTLGLNCYNGHEGIDFNTKSTEGKNIVAAASGTVRQVQWQDPNNTSTFNLGFFVRLWHPQYGLSTLYGHTTSSNPVVGVGSSTPRGTRVAVSGQTGCYISATSTPCPHLHFQVYDGDFTVTSSTQGGNGGSQFNHSVDPFGWATSTYSDLWLPASSTQPWGYLWTSHVALSSYISTWTGSLATSTTWLADQEYIIQDHLIVPASTTLTIQPGAVVKFDSVNGYLQVDGNLNASGTASDPIYFTSIKDDAVGGDANDDAASTTPAKGDWGCIKVNSANASASFAYAVIRYGGSTGGQCGSASDIYVASGTLTLSHATVASSSYDGVAMIAGSVAIVSSTLQTNGQYGVDATTASQSLTVTTSTFTSNGSAPVFVDFTSGAAFTPSGNLATGNGENGFVITGSLATSSTWYKDLPYIVTGVNNHYLVISSGTVTVKPGAVIKFDTTNAYMIVNAGLDVQGTSANNVYFTSINDDQGGDTNGTSTQPAAGNWSCILTNRSNASTTFNWAVIRYGGASLTCPVASDLDIATGTVRVKHTIIASSSYDGIFSMGALTVNTSSSIHDNTNAGVEIDGGTANISKSGIYSNPNTATSSWALDNLTNVTSTATAQNNWWGDPSGPFNAVSNPSGNGNQVSAHVNFTPWLSQFP